MPSSKKSSKNNQTNAKLFFTISHWCLRLTVLVVPLIFLTLTNDALELTKYVAFSLLVVSGVVAGLIGVMLDQGWTWRPTPLLWPLIGWNVAVALATLFSLNRSISLWGDSGYWHHGLVATLLFSLLYLWIVQLVDRHRVKELIWWFVGAVALTGIFSMLQLSGLFLFPQSLLQSASFNPLSVSLSLTTVVIAVTLLISLSLVRESGQRFGRNIALAAVVVAGTTLVLLDRSLGWYALIGGLLAVLIINARSRDNIRWGFWINGLLVITVAGLLIPIPNSLVSDISLATSTSQEVTTATIRDHPITGSGPGTFLYDFSAYRPASFNQSALWDSRFVKAGNDWWQLGATTGVLGLAAWLTLQIAVSRFFWRRFAHEAQTPLTIGLGSAWLMMVVVTFLFPSSFVSWFSYWLILAGAVTLLREEKTVRLPAARLRTLAPFMMAIVLIGGAFVLVTTTRLWLGDRSIARAQAAIDRVDDLETVERYLADAVGYLPHDPAARFALAQNKIIRAQVGLTQQELTEEEASDLLQLAIQDGEVALALAPRRADSYETLIILYGQVNSITGQSTGPSILDLQLQLLKLEPNHPRHYADLGLSYIARSEALRATADLGEAGKAQLAKDLEDALAAFTKAAELKADYATAILGAIRVKQLQGVKAEALALADDAFGFFANDPSSLYTLGTLYHALEQPAKAIQSYQAALALVPDDTTILLALGQLAEETDKKDDARSYYEHVLRVDPENTTAKSRLEALGHE